MKKNFPLIILCIFILFSCNDKKDDNNAIDYYKSIMDPVYKATIKSKSYVDNALKLAKTTFKNPSAKANRASILKLKKELNQTLEELSISILDVKQVETFKNTSDFKNLTIAYLEGIHNLFDTSMRICVDAMEFGVQKYKIVELKNEFSKIATLKVLGQDYKKIQNEYFDEFKFSDDNRKMMKQRYKLD